MSAMTSSGRKRGSRLWDELADVLDGRMQLRVANATRTQRWKVLALHPPTLAQLEGELVLAEGDPDLDFSQWMRKYIESPGLKIGDVVLVHYGGEEYTAFDVVSAGSP